jgi:hypothetical protein
MLVDNKEAELEDSIVITTDDDAGVEVVEVDDTPAEDRNKTPLPKALVDKLEDDDLQEYSAKVKERMSQLKKVWHDERRAKEVADRERTEAVRFASSIIEENKQLKTSLSYGEQAYANTLKHATVGEMEAAKKDYKEAYDSGDADKVISAQVRLNSAQLQKLQADNYRLQFENPLQTPENSVYIQSEQRQAPSPDHKALVWHAKNPWFQTDKAMTSLAKGIHESLVLDEGMTAGSDEYYNRIDKAMRKRFPEKFENDNTDGGATHTSRTRPANVVASATRSTAPKKVHLSTTQLAIAKKFGLTPEQYAREQIKLENRNG